MSSRIRIGDQRSETQVSKRLSARFVGLSAATVGAVLLLSACGGVDYEGSAEELIEGDLATNLGLGPVDATCAASGSAGSAADGDVFSCSATTESGEVINYVATADGDNIQVNTTNVIAGDKMGEVERITAQSLSEQIGVDLPADVVDCGDASVIVSGSTTMTCGVTDPDTGDVYDCTISNIEITGPDDNIAFDFAIAETPRG